VEHRVYTDEGAKNEHDDEDLSEDGLAGDVAVADRGHGDYGEVRAVPVGEVLVVREVCPRITAQLRLYNNHTDVSPSLVHKLK